MKPSDRSLRASLTAIGVDVTLIAIKGILAAVTGSLAIAADAWHSLSDLAVSGVVLAGILFRRRTELAPPAAIDGAVAQPPPSLSSGRLESAITYAVSMAILYVPYEIVTSIRQSAGAPIRNGGIAVAGLLVCFGLSWFSSRLKLTVGRETGSAALAADGWHTWTDMLSTIAVLASIMGQLAGIQLDPLVAVAIAVLIGVNGLELLLSSIVGLARGTPPPPLSLGGWISERFAALWRQESAAAKPAAQEPRAEASAPPAPRRPLPVRKIAAASAIALAAAWIASGLTLVEQDEVGVRLRFGARVPPELEPGLHLLLPWPFESVRRIDRSVARLEVGFRSVSGAPTEMIWDRTRGAGGAVRFGEESLALTGDQGALAVSLVVHYRPRDPVLFAHSANGVESILRSLADSQLREILSSEPVDRLLTEDRSTLLERVGAGLTRGADRLGLGVEITDVLCRELHPPFETVAAFRDAFTAREDQIRVLNQAEAYQNESLPRARGEQSRRLSDARAYAAERRLRATGDAERFTRQALASRASPSLTEYRLFIETIEKGLEGKKKIVASPRANRGGYHLWLFAPDKAPAPEPLARPSKPPPPPEPSPED